MDNRDLAEAEACGWVNTAAPKGKPAPANRTSTPAPAAAPDFNAIPAGLRARDQWVLWKLEDRAGKQTKVPYYVRAGDDGAQVRPASTTDPATWSSFDKIRDDFGRFVRFDQVSGIGFVFVEGDGLVGIDVDHQRDPVTGRWEPGVLEKILSFNSYAELSQSGAGAHVILLGKKPGTRCRGDVEIYDAGRFFVMTGRHIPQTPSDLQEAAAGTLEAQYRQIDPGRRTVEPPARSSPLPVGLEDAEVMRRAASALNGPKFTALNRAGDLAAYGGDHSAADLALCNLLVFWTQDRDQIDRIFRGGERHPELDARRSPEILCSRHTRQTPRTGGQYQRVPGTAGYSQGIHLRAAYHGMGVAMPENRAP
jgi:primase-polymerase (primpol)-like protein